MAGEIEVRAREAESTLSAGFARGERGSLVGTLGELRFFRRFLDEVNAIEDDLGSIHGTP
jgi:hypothetical protein